MPRPPISRRSALKLAAGAFAAPFVFRGHAHAAPSETLLHVAVGVGGRGVADLTEITASPHVKLVAVCDVDADAIGPWKKKFPDVRVYADWREMFDKEKFDTVNVCTPDHTHAGPTMRALKAGKPVFTQKPLTQTISEARQPTLAAAETKVPTQMGIQIHSSTEHKTVVATVQAGLVGKIREVHSWSGKDWGDPEAKPDRTDPVPANLNWDLWLGPTADRPFIGDEYYHPGNWRKRLDFGCGTFGDMGCHILDPVFGALGVGNPSNVRSVGGRPNATNWGLNVEVGFTFPGTKFTTDTVKITWYDGNRRPPAEIAKLIEPNKVPNQGSIYVGTDGVIFSPYIGMPVLLPADKFQAAKLPVIPGKNHFLEWVEACRGNGTPSAPFSYAGPLTEMVLLGCLATRFPDTDLRWDPVNLKVTNVAAANQYVRREPRKGWDEPGL
ncbi:MAG: Gfo/Idh/MocA family protein [Fimbriiglobus sp.]